MMWPIKAVFLNPDLSILTRPAPDQKIFEKPDPDHVNPDPNLECNKNKKSFCKFSQEAFRNVLKIANCQISFLLSKCNSFHYIAN